MKTSSLYTENLSPLYTTVNSELTLASDGYLAAFNRPIEQVPLSKSVCYPQASEIHHYFMTHCPTSYEWNTFDYLPYATLQGLFYENPTTYAPWKDKQKKYCSSLLPLNTDYHFLSNFSISAENDRNLKLCVMYQLLNLHYDLSRALGVDETANKHKFLRQVVALLDPKTARLGLDHEENIQILRKHTFREHLVALKKFYSRSKNSIPAQMLAILDPKKVYSELDFEQNTRTLRKHSFKRRLQALEALCSKLKMSATQLSKTNQDYERLANMMALIVRLEISKIRVDESNKVTPSFLQTVSSSKVFLSTSTALVTSLAIMGYLSAKLMLRDKTYEEKPSKWVVQQVYALKP